MAAPCRALLATLLQPASGHLPHICHPAAASLAYPAPTPPRTPPQPAGQEQQLQAAGAPPICDLHCACMLLPVTGCVSVAVCAIDTGACCVLHGVACFLLAPSCWNVRQLRHLGSESCPLRKHCHQLLMATVLCAIPAGVCPAGCASRCGGPADAWPAARRPQYSGELGCLSSAWPGTSACWLSAAWGLQLQAACVDSRL